MLEFILEFVKTYWAQLARVIIVPGIAFVLLFDLIAVWFERKLLAHSMLRIGPLHVGKVAGWLQIIADFIKLLAKEINTPRNANRLLFNSLPILLVVIPTTGVAFIPFGQNWIIYNPGGLSLLLFLAVMSLTVFMPIMIGWASNNKYTIIGSLRAGYVYISAEIPILLSAIGVAIMAGSFDLVKIVEAQSKIWFIIPQVLGFIVFVIALLMESERVPFDIPVAEQELVLGWRTEYTGINFGFVMMSEYSAICSWSLLLVTLYLGGYNGPLIFGDRLISSISWVLIKLAIVVTALILLRSVFPRYRIDQALKISWHYLIPLAILNVIISAGLTFFFPQLKALIG